MGSSGSDCHSPAQTYGATITTKLLTRTDTITCILFWLVVLQAIFGLIMAGYDGQIDVPRGTEWGWVTLIGICGLCAHFCITSALQLASCNAEVMQKCAHNPQIPIRVTQPHSVPRGTSICPSYPAIISPNIACRTTSQKRMQVIVSVRVNNFVVMVAP